MLNKITIDNFKSLKHIDYNCAGLNLLTGLNGAGKSSFIQALRLMQAVSPRIGEPRTEVPAAFGSSESITYCYGHDDIRLSFGFTSADDADGHEIIRVIRHDNNVKRVGLLSCEHPSWSNQFLVSHGDYWHLLARQGNGEAVSEAELSAAKASCDNFENVEADMRASEAKTSKAFAGLMSGMLFIDSFRKKPTDVHKGGVYSDLSFMFGDTEVDSFDPEGENVAEYLSKSARGHSGGNGYVEKINACLQWVSPGASLHIEKKRVGDEEYYVETVSFGNIGQTRGFKPQNVGFGISYILPVLTALISAKPGRILIIENPEAHLHPRGQAEMGKLIAETVARGVQVFVETHSDHVINGIRVAVKKGIVKPSDVNIAFFVRGPHDVAQEDGTTSREIYAEVTNIKVDANGALSEWPKDFMDEWGIQQMKLLRP